MNLTLNYEGFESNLVMMRSVYDGVQYLFRFKNDYGASVIKHGGSYGYRKDMWELAVVKFNSDDMNDWDLNYDTDITNDVIGYLDDKAVRDLLTQIKEL